MSIRHKAFFGLLLVATLWGSAGVTAKFLIAQTSPFVVAFYRFLAATLIILPFFLRAKKAKGWFWELLPLGLFNAGNVLFYYSGLQLTTANTGSLLGTGTPILTALFSYFLIGESISKNKLLGIVVGLLGALCIILTPIVEKGQAVGTSLTGNLFMLGSTLSWTFYIIRSKYSSGKATFDPIIATFVNFLTCTVSALLCSLFFHAPLAVPAFSQPSYLLIFCYVVLGITVTTFFVFQWSVQHVSATTASLKDYFQLIVGVTLNTLFLHETFTPVFVIGSLLIVCGMMIATGERISKKLVSVIETRHL